MARNGTVTPSPGHRGNRARDRAADARLETRVGRLNTLTRKGASHAASEASDFVSETLSETAERVRNGATQ